MNTNNLAKKIASKLVTFQQTTIVAPTPIEKEATMDKTLDLFGAGTSDSPESSSESEKDLFGNDVTDRENANLPPKVENTDKTDSNSPDLKDLDQGDAATRNSDDRYTGSGDGPELK
jgi:hypothetical protein